MDVKACSGLVDPDSRPAATSYVVGQLDLGRLIQIHVPGTLLAPRDTMLTCVLRDPLLVADVSVRWPFLAVLQEGRGSPLWKHLGGTPNSHLEAQGSFPKGVMFSIDRDENKEGDPLHSHRGDRMSLLICIESSEVFCRHLPEKWLRVSESGHGTLEPWPGDQTRAEKSQEGSIRRLGLGRAIKFKARRWVPPRFHLKGTGQRRRVEVCVVGTEHGKGSRGREACILEKGLQGELKGAVAVRSLHLDYCFKLPQPLVSGGEKTVREPHQRKEGQGEKRC